MTDPFFSHQVEKKSRPFSPTLPDSFIPRPDQLTPLKDLLTQPSEHNTLVITAKEGVGGMGTTSLALALTRDESVRATYPDGMLWATLGPDPDILTPLGQWLFALDERGLQMPTIAMASAQLRHLLKRRRMLLVVDEAWSVEDLLPFQVVEETGCRLLVTTRDVVVPKAQAYVLGEMTGPQSQQLFETQLKRSLEQRHRKDALQFAKAVGYLPLSLHLGVSQIKNGLSWPELMAGITPKSDPHAITSSPDAEPEYSSSRPRLGRSLATLQNLWNPSQTKDRQHQARQTCLTFVLRQLAPELRLHLASLGLFPHNIDITPRMAETVWGLSLSESRQHLQDLKRQGFLSHGTLDAEQGQSYSLHPVMRDIARWIMTLPKDAEMPGLEMTWSTAQQQFLERYQPHLKAARWHSIPDDSYIQSHLIWHLEQAGWQGEIHQLLQTLNAAGGNAWYDIYKSQKPSDHQFGQASDFTIDLARAWQLAQSIYAEAPEYSTGLQVRYALTSAFVQNHQHQSHQSSLWSEDWAFTKILLNAARYLPGLGSKIISSTLFPSTLDTQFKEQTIFELLKNVHQESREMAVELTADLLPNPAPIDALIRLVPDYPSFSLPLWQILQKSNDPQRLVKGVACLAQSGAHHLHQDLFPMLPKMQHPFDRFLILAQIQDRLPDVLKLKAKSFKQDCLNDLSARRQGLGQLPLTYGNILGPLNAATEDFLELYNYSGWAIALCFEQYPSRRLDEAYSQVIRSRSEEKRSKTFAFLIPRLSEKHRREIWPLIPKLIDPECKARVLSSIHPFRPKAIGGLLEISKLFENKTKLKILIDSLPGPSTLVESIFATIMALSQPHDRWPYLLQLLPYLSRDQYSDLVAVIQDSPFDAEGICTLLNVLKPDQVEIAWGIVEKVETIPPVYERATALGQIIPYLPTSLKHEAFEIAQRIQFPYARVIALRNFIPDHPEAAHAAIESLKSCHAESPDDVYDALIPMLPSAEQAEAIALITTIPDEVSQLQHLIQALPYQPDLMDDIKTLVTQNPDLYHHCELSEVLEKLSLTCQADLSPANPAQPRTLELILAMLPLIDWVYSPQGSINREFGFCELVQTYLEQPHNLLLNPTVISKLLDFFYLIPREEKRAETLEQILQTAAEIESITPECWLEWLEKLSRYQPAEFHQVFSRMVNFLMKFSNNNTLNQVLESIHSVREQWL